MAENMPRVTKADLEKGVVKLAHQDESFRQQLLKNPKEALKAGGFELPPGVDLKVVQEEPGQLFLVLPVKAQPAKDGRELGDEELAAVAGGLGDLSTRAGSLSAAGRLGSNLQTGNLQNSKQLSPGNLAGIRVSWG